MRYKYTDEDIKFLRENYPIGNWDMIHKRFPQLTDCAIHHKCNKLGIKFDISYKKKYDGTISRNKWNDEEVETIKTYYSKIPMDEMLKLLPNRNKDMIVNKASRLGIPSYSKVNSKWTEKEIQYIIDNWKIQPDKLIANELGKTFRAVKAKREELKLYRQDMESNSYNALSKYLRGQNQKWKKDSMKSSNYKCVLTGSKNFEIHHLYGVSNILNDIMDKYNFNIYDNFSDYKEEELHKILDAFIIEQNKYPLGVCVSKDIHVLFHSLYGQYYNTPEQWYEFEKDFRAGIYNDMLLNKTA